MIRRVFGRDSRAGIVAGGSAAYSNAVLIGIPLMQAALGDEGTVFLIVIVAVHLPIMMLVSVFLNEWMLARGGDGGRSDVAARGLSPPGHLAGDASDPDRRRARPALARDRALPFRASPRAIIEPLARSAGPLALFASGMALVNYGIARQIRPAIAISVLKLVLLPVLVFARGTRDRPAADRRRGADADGRLPDRASTPSDRAAARHGRGARLEHGAHLDRRRRSDGHAVAVRCCSGRSARGRAPRSAPPASRRLRAGRGSSPSRATSTASSPSLVEDQAVVEIARLGKAEQRLQQPMHRRRGFEVLAAHHVRDALERIVDDDRDVIARRDLLAGQHHVAPSRGIGRDALQLGSTPNGIDRAPGQRARGLTSARAMSRRSA